MYVEKQFIPHTAQRQYINLENDIHIKELTNGIYTSMLFIIVGFCMVCVHRARGDAMYCRFLYSLCT